MNFTVKMEPKGFTTGMNNSNLVYNGTFLNNFSLPQIGYNDAFEVGEPNLREENGLPEKPRIKPITDTLAAYRNFISPQADFVTFEATVSTAPDQIAMVPGYLQREWEEDGRRFFHYKMDSPMLFFFNISSARYAVRDSVWVSPSGQEVATEIYYHPPHTYNLDKMMEAMHASLSNYSRTFGPYQHRQVRILEFPYATFAQSFANTIPYSENFGFIADIDEDDTDKVDWVYFVTAHELAHQWWAHQVVSADVQGGQIMSETMSQYGALNVIYEQLGEEKTRTFLKQELNNYTNGRAAESRAEMPLLLTENQQYIHYRKGIVVMNALRELLSGAGTYRRNARLPASGAVPVAAVHYFARLVQLHTKRNARFAEAGSR